MKIYSFISQKGGVGKSQCACNVAASLALHHGKKVCLLDIDEQATAARNAGVLAPNERPPLGEKILSRELSDCVYKSPIENLYAIPADPTVNALKFANTEMRERLLEFAVPDLAGYFDFLIIDTPSGLGLWTWNAVYISDQIIIPVEADEAAQRCVIQTLEFVKPIIERYRPEVDYNSYFNLVMSKVNQNTTVVNSLLREMLEESFQKQTLKVELQLLNCVVKSREVGMSIFEYALIDKKPASKMAAEDFMQLTTEILTYEYKNEDGTITGSERNEAACG